MVITSTPSNGSSTTALEQVEPVKDDPPIGAQRQPVTTTKPDIDIEKAVRAGPPTLSGREQLCQDAHVYPVDHLSTQLGVDVR